MIKNYIQYLNEVFDTKFDIDWISSNNANINVDGKNYNFFTKIVVNFPKFGKISHVQFTDEDGNFNITGGAKNSFKVFSAIKQALLYWLEKEKPDGFYFISKEESRNRLYYSFSKKIEQESNYIFGYDLASELIETDTVNVDENDGLYVFVRKGRRN